MAEKKAPKKAAKSSRATAKSSGGFTDEERAAIRERAKEVKAEKSGGSGAEKSSELSAVLDKIAAMPPADRAMAERIHAIITGGAPELAPKLWYGMPAYAKNGSVICFFQDARKFKTRYATLGFSDKARLDDGNMWPTSYALMELNASDEAKIVALVKKAVG
jgi:uncharacterized protein YdhG (YjbR/CyaY superfamily)